MAETPICDCDEGAGPEGKRCSKISAGICKHSCDFDHRHRVLSRTLGQYGEALRGWGNMSLDEGGR